MKYLEDNIKSIINSIQGYENQNFAITRIYSGTNYISKIESTPPLIFREFGPSSLTNPDSERQIFQQASDLEIGPKCLILTPTYRIEEYIEGSTMLRKDCKKHLKSTAEALSSFHSIPCGSTSNTIESYLVSWKAKLEQNFLNTNPDPRKEEILEDLNSYSEEVLWILVKDTEEFVLCHNDFSYGNLILTHNGVSVIDFEYAGPGHPSVDLASFLIEVMFDFSQPIYRYLPEDELDQNSQKKIIEYYAGIRGVNQVELWEKVKRSKAVLCYLGALWAGCQYSDENPSMLDYARIRLELFIKYKGEI